MKLICHRGALSTAFQTVSGVVPTRTPKPVLQNVKLEANKGSAVLVGTDSEVAIRYRVLEAEIQQPGELLLPTNRVLAILREMQGDTVSLETTDSGTWVRGDRAEYKLPSIDPSEFPAVAEFEEKDSFSLQAGAFKQMIRRTLFATDAESTRYALGGILIDLKGEAVTLAATDTRRLAVVRGQCAAGGKPGGDTAPVVPSKAMQLIERSLTDDNETISLAVRNNDVLVKSAATTIYSRLVEGRFPRYQDVIPNSSNVTIELPTSSFYAAVRQAQIVTSEESRGVDFKFASGMLTLSSRAADIGESKVELPISYSGNDLVITFDPRYVAEFLRVLEPEQQVHLDLTDGESAAVFRTDDGYTYIVMPLSRDR